MEEAVSVYLESVFSRLNMHCFCGKMASMRKTQRQWKKTLELNEKKLMKLGFQALQKNKVVHAEGKFISSPMGLTPFRLFMPTLISLEIR